MHTLFKFILQHQEAYECILAASNGTSGEKRLAAGFITKFLSYFPEMTEKAMNALLDLVVDEDTMVTSGCGLIFTGRGLYVFYRSEDVLSRVYPACAKDQMKLYCALKSLMYLHSSL